MSGNIGSSFVCATCGKNYSRRDFLTRHELNHKGIRPFKCEPCNLQFTRRDMLVKHYRSNSHKKFEEKNVSDTRAGSSLKNEITDISSPKRQSSPSIKSDSIPSTSNVKKLRIANFLNDYDEKIHTPPLQPTIIRPSSASGTLSGGSVDVNFGNLISTNIDPSKNYDPENNLPSGYIKRRFASKFDQKKISSSENGEEQEESPKEFLSLLDMSGGFIDNLLWLFTDNFPSEMIDDVNNLNNIPHPESEVIDVDATQNFDIAPASYDLAEIHSHMFGQKKVKLIESTRLKILEIFDEVEALKNVSLSRFDEYMDLYWFNFAQSFPIIHQVTFDPNVANIYLLVSILIIGMAHTADRLEYELSIVWNKKYRKVIREVIDEKTQLSLPTMQALILHNFSARNFGDTTLCQISQIDHGSNLLYLKFSGFLDNLDEPIISKSENTTKEELYNQWQNWIIYETSKRTVFFEFICDTQHITFSKLELSSFDIKLELPCSDEVWNASTPEEFFASYQIQPNNLVTRPKLNIHNDVIDNNDESKDDTEDKVTKVVMERYVTSNLNNNNKVLGKWPSFFWGVKSLMMEYRENQREFSLNCYSPFTRYIILHSLIRICWHTRGHGLLDLGIISQNRLNDFFNKLELAFANWKGYFDLHIKLYDDQVKARNALRESGSENTNEQFMKESGVRSQVLLNNYGPTNACWANLSLFYTGLFTLYADISSLSKFAKEYDRKWSSGNINNNKINQNIKEIEYARNDILVEQWAASSNGEIAVVEACKFLILVYKHEETINTFSHVPPSVYIAVLIIWSFEKKIATLKSKANESQLELQNLYPDPDQYFDKRDYVIGIVARNDAKQYIDLITNLADEDESTDDSQKDKIFKQRQYYTVGVVCYALFLLRHCKWPHSIDIVKKLEHIVDTFKK
ncbi:Zinc finger protein [Wickerhamomyces ciferrii]|uniref:Zinc finger protein n=1 Tax=Wickerhamomyces ciferrii (strain ATCC 14091 / BCRC 22168 / CBS 111 / JCM 3599 / NBRC 0793 / NRRL Y-1031 F-60-10) TaxID=1206466 RepID=K0KWH6_WICCF|nr:Zinc finger protein [Wickerhamomyces ciferrii]CCH45849.1 Zinc finger protein [Wickerhamomyces ciferrii]